MKGFDAFAGVIKSGGKTRRAAKMVILNADHPDIEKFVGCKAKEEKKAYALLDIGIGRPRLQLRPRDRRSLRGPPLLLDGLQGHGRIRPDLNTSLDPRPVPRLRVLGQPRREPLLDRRRDPRLRGRILPLFRQRHRLFLVGASRAQAPKYEFPRE